MYNLCVYILLFHVTNHVQGLNVPLRYDYALVSHHTYIGMNVTYFPLLALLLHYFGHLFQLIV